MEDKGLKVEKADAIKRQMIVLSNEKVEEYYEEAKKMAEAAISARLSNTQVSSVLSAIDTTASSAEFLNYLKRQVGKDKSKIKKSGGVPPAWVAPVQDPKEDKTFGDVLVERLERIRQQAIRDAEDRQMETEDKIKLTVLYLRQYLKAFEAHFLYRSGTSLDE
jgi:hypothetical protein